MRKHIIIFSFIIFVLSAYLISAGEQSSKVDSKVIESLNENNKARVFVEFNDNVKGISALSDAKKQIASSIESGKLRYDFGSTISLEVNKNDLTNLEKDSRIKKIELVGTKQILLQQSVPLINASITWPLKEKGFNLTGVGETVCILDTGVNYTHPDLGGCYGNNSLSSTCKVWGGWDFYNSDSDPMDDQGHGTHVSGIVAANGSIMGVAPGARIVMIKVCNSAGDDCPDDVIISGINWCVNNASAYNISAISISLGTLSVYTNYCDDNNPLTTAAINLAAAKNISVVIAAGNSLSTTGISDPACIQNATPVGSTTKSDTISSFSNRNSLVQLMAPGGTIGGNGSCSAGVIDSNRICSTAFDGTYISMSGTSMATPHVAGAIAIMHEYLRLTGQTRTTQQIESTLNATGKRIPDGVLGNYSRINVYNAIMGLDNIKPNISILSPTNTTYNNKTIIINILASDDLSFDSIWWYNETNNLTYSSPVLYNFSEGSNTIIAYANDSAGNLNQTSVTFNVDTIAPFIAFASPLNTTYTINNITINISTTGTQSVWFTNSSGRNETYNGAITRLFADGQNTLIAYANDSAGNLNQTNVTFFVSAIPILTITSPINNSWYNAFRFNVSLNEDGFCWFSMDGGLTNQSMTNYSSSVYYFTNVSASNSSTNSAYNVTFYCNDSENNINISSPIFFGIDKTPPSVSLSSPSDSASYTGTQTISFQFTVTDNTNITKCALIVDGGIIYNSSAITASTNTITRDLSSGSNYTWYINCTDSGGNVGNSSSRTLAVNTVSSSNTGGSSGGGSTTTTNIAIISSYIINSTALSKGYNHGYYSGDSLKFSIANAAGVLESHTMRINYVGAGYTNFTITSSPINLTLYPGQEKRLNLTSKDYYDLYLKLESIRGGRTNITIKGIHEAIPVIPAGVTGRVVFSNVTNSTVEEVNVSGNATDENEKNSTVSRVSPYIVYIVLAVIVIRVGIYLLVKWHRSMNKKSKKKR